MSYLTRLRNVFALGARSVAQLIGLLAFWGRRRTRAVPYAYGRPRSTRANHLRIRAGFIDTDKLQLVDRSRDSRGSPGPSGPTVSRRTHLAPSGSAEEGRQRPGRGRCSWPSMVAPHERYLAANMLSQMVESHTEAEEPGPQGWCVCGQKVTIADAREVTLPNGRPGWEGHCPECGSPLFAIRRKAAGG